MNAGNAQILENTQIMTEFAIAFAAIYMYIGENASTIVRSKPIAEDITATLKYLSDIESFYANLKTGDPDFDRRIDAVSKGDICKYFSKTNTITNLTECSLLGKQAATRGLVGLNSYLLANL